MLLLRLFAISAVEYMIGKDWIKTLNTAVLAFSVTYTILFIAFVLIVNIDLYRLRIVFNFVNMHGNTSGIISHLIELWIFMFVIMIVIQNINIPVPGFQQLFAMSEENKAYLMYRLEMITAITWLIMIGFIFL